MGFLVASSSISSAALRLRVILIFLLLAALTSVAAAAGSTTYKVGRDHVGWNIPPWKDDSGNIAYFVVWSSMKRFSVGDTLLFVYDTSSKEKDNNVLQVTPTAYDVCDTSSPIAVYATGYDSVLLNTTGTYYFLSYSYNRCQQGQALSIYVEPNSHGDKDNDSVPSAPALEPAAVSPSSASALASSASSPSPDHYDSISGAASTTTTTTTTTTTSTPPSHSTSASASGSSTTSHLLGMLAAAVMVIYLG